MKIHVKNQLSGKIEFCCGDSEYELRPEQKITIKVKDEDCIYFDRLCNVESENKNVKDLVNTLRKYGAQEKAMLQIINITKRAMDAETENNHLKIELETVKAREAALIKQIEVEKC